MKVGPGAVVFLRNPRTREMFAVMISEMYHYNGAYICVGGALSHEIYLPAVRGRIQVPARASCPVLVPGADAAVSRFVEVTQGVPWQAYGSVPEAQMAANGIPVLNMARVTGWGPNGKTQAAVVERAQAMVDAFHHYREHHELPLDLVRARLTAASGNGAHA